MLGIEEDEADVAWREEWEVERVGGVASPRSGKGKEKVGEREKARMKKRVSSGGGAGR